MASSQLTSCAKCLVGAGLIVLVIGVVFLYSGAYPMGADVQHYAPTHWALETLRERSIASAAADISVPRDLNTAERLLAGGADYNDMCTGCHLRPGKTESDLSQGLYPAPPGLSQENHAEGDKTTQAKRSFWIIKHGIKASGMPAWAPGHDDERIWNMVAFLQRLPELSPEQYQILTARGDSDNDHQQTANLHDALIDSKDTPATGDAEVAEVVRRFHDALSNGDGELARSLLDDNVIIYEGGGVERSASDYASHHMLADMKFLAAMNLQVLEHEIKVYGDSAISMSRTKMRGNYQGKMLDRESMETISLSRKNGEWKIVHIHWSD